MLNKPALNLLAIVILNCVFSSPLLASSPILLSQHSSSEEIKVQDYPLMDKEVQRVWRKFTQRLRSGDAQGAAMFISEPSRQRYLEIFHDIGEDIRNLPDTWSEIKLVSTFGQFAEYLVTRTEGGDKLMHTMMFVRNSDGKWYLAEL